MPNVDPIEDEIIDDDSPINNSDNVDMNRLAVRNQVIRDIVSLNPGFIVRYGLTFFASILLIMVIATWFVNYPDLIATNGSLQATNPPTKVVAKVQGKLTQLFVKEREIVKQGEILGFVESVGDPYEILGVLSSLDTIRLLVSNGDDGRISNFLNIKTDNLGQTQSGYQSFISAYLQYKQAIGNGILVQKLKLLKEDYDITQQVNANVVQQEQKQEEDFAIAKQQFLANQKLFNDHIISTFDFNAEKSKIISKELGLEQLKSTIINAQSTNIAKMQAILDLENQISQARETFLEVINSTLATFEEWKKNYILTAPIDGSVVFAGFFQVNQLVNAGEVILYVSPLSTSFFVQINIRQSDFGEIKPGQKVLMSFPSYPVEKFGKVKGVLRFISDIASDSGYYATIALPNGLTTTFGKEIKFRDKLSVQCQIITRDIRLFQRFIYKGRGMLQGVANSSQR
ncbi:MAG: HlyD family efflux transporter periplasmic adaptor subunit [Phycisphaerales bacterium]|nr:HlyD family efflux transporter periplasmic adaptor subunit [Phycisphaerales bacterium]